MQERDSPAEQELRESTESITLGGLEGGRPVAAEKMKGRSSIGWQAKLRQGRKRYFHGNAKEKIINTLIRDKKGDTSTLSSSEIYSQWCQRKGRNSLLKEKKGESSALKFSEGKIFHKLFSGTLDFRRRSTIACKREQRLDLSSTLRQERRRRSTQEEQVAHLSGAQETLRGLGKVSASLTTQPASWRQGWTFKKVNFFSIHLLQRDIM